MFNIKFDLDDFVTENSEGNPFLRNIALCFLMYPIIGFEEEHEEETGNLALKTSKVCQYLFEELPTAAEDELSYQTVFYDAAKLHFGHSKDEIFTCFKCLYVLYYRSDKGPRWGPAVAIFGRDVFLDILRKRINDPLLKMNR